VGACCETDADRDESWLNGPGWPALEGLALVEVRPRLLGRWLYSGRPFSAVLDVNDPNPKSPFQLSAVNGLRKSS
jgi:hypothetical protein